MMKTNSENGFSVSLSNMDQIHHSKNNLFFYFRRCRSRPIPFYGYDSIFCPDPSDFLENTYAYTIERRDYIMMTDKTIPSSHGSLTKYTVDGGDGYAFSCVNYGATLTSLTAPDKNGRPGNILLQFDEADALIEDQTYFFSKAIGRVGGRIQDGDFQSDGKKYVLPRNEGTNTLHGGAEGFHHAWWDAKSIENGIEFSRVIRPEDDGFPGVLKASVIYRWENDHRLAIELKGVNESDTATLFNPTIHSYFNLNNDQTEGLAHHELTVHAEQVVETREDLIPTGRLLPVKNTPFDFRQPKRLDAMIESVQKDGGAGYDHPFKVSGPLIATLRNADSGRHLDIYSDRNALIVYTLNTVNGSQQTVNSGLTLNPFMGVALEPQTLPDANHHSAFGNIVLAGHQEKTYRIVYQLSVDL